MKNPGNKTKESRKPGFTSAHALQGADLGHLIDLARAGQQGAFAEIVKRFRPSLLGRATSILKDGHLAEDAVQETFLEAHKSLGNLKHTAAFAAWTARILFKYCDRIRRKRTEISTAPNTMIRFEDTSGESADQILERPEAANLISNLSGVDQRIAESFYELGWSQKQIATDLEIPLHTVKNRLKRIRRDFQKMHNPSGFISSSKLLQARAA